MPPQRVSLFVTCLVDLLYPEVGEATVSLLQALGLRVEFPSGQTCCGQPAFNSGFEEDARRVARNMLDSFADSEVVVSPSGSCTAMVRSYYSHLFEGTPDEDRARDLSNRTYELSEFIVDVQGVNDLGGRWEGKATYHDSCHGLRELGLSGQGRKLLAGVSGLELIEMEHTDMCCGFGGTFALRLPAVATAMADEKLAAAEATNADIMVAGDTGCLMHLAGRVSRLGSRLRPMHLATLLAEAGALTPHRDSGTRPLPAR